MIKLFLYLFNTCIKDHVGRIAATLKRHLWFLSQGAHTLVGKPYFNHENFWEDKLENVCKQTFFASLLSDPFSSFPCSINTTRTNSANNIVQISLPSGVFMNLTNGCLGQNIGVSKADRGLNMLSSLFALGGSLSSGFVFSLPLTPTGQHLLLWFKYPFGGFNSWYLVTPLIP